jgi:4-hydroxy-3-polyprenylbenzoate decarboxylase
LVAKAREGLSLRSIAESLDHCFDASENSSVQLIVLVDDDEFASKSLKNWLWVTFTRSNPAIDIDGVHAFTDFKHWGCKGPLLIDARIKPHHAPPLMEDPEVTAKVDAMAARGGAIAKYL